MKVELTEAQVAAVVASAKAEVKTRLVDAVMACFNIQQLAAEIKNEAVKQAAQQIAKRVEEKYNTSGVIERALQSAEDRVNGKIAKILENGIKIKLES